jgi:hypothetical protein
MSKFELCFVFHPKNKRILDARFDVFTAVWIVTPNSDTSVSEDLGGTTYKTST